MKIIIKKLLVLLTRLLPTKPLFGNKIRIIMYHGIDATGLSESAFRQQMTFINKHFSCYWASEINQILDPQFQSEKPPMILTFDDGLLNNATVVAPILDKLGMKATYYLVSDLLDGKSMLWNHELRGRLAAMLDSDHFKEICSEVLPEKSQATPQQIVERMKLWDHDQRTQLIKKIHDLAPNPSFTQEMLDAWLIMSVEDAIDLPACIEIGSHTKTHPILDTLDNETAAEEITASRYQLEKLTSKPVKTFCYPNGNYSQEMLSTVKSHYTAAVSVHEGFASSNERYELKRIPAARNMPDFIFRLFRPSS